MSMLQIPQPMSPITVTPSLRAVERLRPLDRPVMRQTWSRLLFLHWRFEPEVVQAALPDGLTVDTHDGDAWVAIVPFEMNQIRPVGLPALPHISYFLETNLRTYVIDPTGAPAVWFFSLTANRRLACALGRRWFRLPYHFGSLTRTVDREGGYVDVCRRAADPGRRESRVRWRPQPGVAPAQPGTLEEFLVERYRLLAPWGEQGWAAGRVFHQPYPLQPVELLDWNEDLFAVDGLRSPGRPPDHQAFVESVDVEVFPLRLVAASSAAARGPVSGAKSSVAAPTR